MFDLDPKIKDILVIALGCGIGAVLMQTLAGFAGFHSITSALCSIAIGAVIGAGAAIVWIYKKRAQSSEDE